ncbi:MAG: HisA/HisF-related TIM barrel protein, partial [Nanoarchaeota archaeon]
VGIDVKINEQGKYEVYSRHGKKATGKDPVAWAKEVEKLGAGEIFLNSIDRDGTAEGYDTELIRSVAENVNIPVIACGGVGTFEDFKEGIVKGKASAVAAGNIFNFTENSVIRAKKIMLAAGVNVRPLVKPINPLTEKSGLQKMRG